MNCDDTFEVLTRGPFPIGNGNIDDAVERHLAACHDCRELAEALRPAVGLFHEALAGTESLSLPGYRGEFNEADDGSIVMLAARAKPATRALRSAFPGDSRSRSMPLWPVAAAAVAGLMLGLLAGEVRRENAVTIGAAPAGPDQLALRSSEINREGRLLLASLHLPPGCLGANDGEERTPSVWYRCCTHCHAANRSAAVPAVQVTALTTSCLVCHSNVYRAEVSWSDWNNRRGNSLALLGTTG